MAAASSVIACPSSSIVVVGSCNVDMCTYTPRFPAPGETILGTEYQQGFGGKGSNQAVMAAKLSLENTVAMVGCVGTDLHGEGFRKAMAAEGINIELLASAPAGVSTGTAAILIDASGENCVVVAPGANQHVTEAMVRGDAVSSKISSCKVLITQNEIPEASTAAAISLACKVSSESGDGFPISLSNPAPAPESLPAALCADIDVLVLNESEAALLAGEGTSASSTCADAEVAAFVGESAKRLRPPKEGRGRVLIVTRGHRGAVVATVPAGGVGGVSVEVVPGMAAKTVADTVGAGDAFVGALAATLNRCSDANAILSDTSKVAEAVRRACAVATMTVEAKGTQTSYPSREDAIARVPELEAPL